MTGEILDLIKATIGTEIPNAGLTRDGVLIKMKPGDRTAGSLTSGTNPKDREHEFQGFYDDKMLSHLPETVVQQGDRAVLLIGATIQGGVEPEPGDEIILENETTVIVSLMERDPAEATFLCQSRKT